MRIAAFLLAAGLAASSGLQARIGNTLNDELRIFAGDIATQCASVRDQLKEFDVTADPLTGFTLKDAVQSLCVCMPEKIAALTGTLPAETLANAVSEVEFLSLFNPAVINKCAGEQVHAMYGAECGERFKKADLDVHRYCACMKDVVAGYSNGFTAAIAAAASDYLPVAAEEERNGKPVPPRPPILEDYYQADQRCKGAKTAPSAAQP